MEQDKDFSQIVCVQADGKGDYNTVAYEEKFSDFIPSYKEHLAEVLRGDSTVRNYSHCFFTNNGTLHPLRCVTEDGSLFHLFVGGKITSNVNGEEIKKQYLDDLLESMHEVRDYMHFLRQKNHGVPG